MKVAVVGVTGLVGTVMRDVLTERNFPVSQFLPVASARSVGKKLNFQGKTYKIIGMEDAVAARPDIAIFLRAVQFPKNGHLSLQRLVRR